MQARKGHRDVSDAEPISTPGCSGWRAGIDGSVIYVVTKQLVRIFIYLAFSSHKSCWLVRSIFPPESSTQLPDESLF